MRQRSGLNGQPCIGLGREYDLLHANLLDLEYS
jgi:hypothetical protein